MNYLSDFIAALSHRSRFEYAGHGRRQLRAALRQVEELATIPVVVVSAQESFAAGDLGAVGAFRKPLDVDALVKIKLDNC